MKIEWSSSMVTMLQHDYSDPKTVDRIDGIFIIVAKDSYINYTLENRLNQVNSINWLSN